MRAVFFRTLFIGTFFFGPFLIGALTIGCAGEQTKQEGGFNYDCFTACEKHPTAGLQECTRECTEKQTTKGYRPK